MKWVIQNNLYNEYGYVRFIEALERLGSDYIVVKPVPFTNILLPADFDSMTQEVDDVEEPTVESSDGKVVICGATSLSRISKAKGWSPGTYLNENFDYEIWRDGFGRENMLNADAIVAPVQSMPMTTHDWVFVRPTEDTKSFSGTVMSKYDLQDWLLQISVIEEEEFVPLHKNTNIIVAPTKEIYAEYRMFIVDSTIVASSMYKCGNMVRSDEYVDDRIKWFTAGMIQTWEPADAFAIDIADTPDGLKIIEINNINSSGFYDADVQQIIMAIEQMEKYGRLHKVGIEL